jgi:hypothetical protein
MKSVLSNSIFNTSSGSISWTNLLVLAALFALVFLVLYLLKKYVIPLFMKGQDQSKNQLFLLRVETVTWLAYTLVALVVLFADSFTVTAGIIVVVGLVGFNFWRDFFPGLLMRVSNKYSVNDLVRHEPYSGKLIKMGYTTMHIRTEQEEEIYIPYRKVVSDVFIKRQSTGKLMSAKMILHLGGKDVDRVLREVPHWLFECPWSIPQNENQVQLQPGGMLHITIYSTDHQSLAKVERFIEKSLEDLS